VCREGFTGVPPTVALATVAVEAFRGGIPVVPGLAVGGTLIVNGFDPMGERVATIRS